MLNTLIILNFNKNNDIYNDKDTTLVLVKFYLIWPSLSKDIFTSPLTQDWSLQNVCDIFNRKAALSHVQCFVSLLLRIQFPYQSYKYLNVRFGWLGERTKIWQWTSAIFKCLIIDKYVLKMKSDPNVTDWLIYIENIDQRRKW